MTLGLASSRHKGPTVTVRLPLAALMETRAAATG
jgi:hypothetical protein